MVGAPPTQIVLSLFPLGIMGDTISLSSSFPYCPTSYKLNSISRESERERRYEERPKGIFSLSSFSLSCADLAIETSSFSTRATRAQRGPRAGGWAGAASPEKKERGEDERAKEKEGGRKGGRRCPVASVMDAASPLSSLRRLHYNCTEQSRQLVPRSPSNPQGTTGLEERFFLLPQLSWKKRGNGRGMECKLGVQLSASLEEGGRSATRCTFK